MANNLGLSVLAEGVESQEEADTLVALGCSDIQGYLYSKPLVAEDLETYISEQT
jgi:EAL domain-containing protein (putative c-di-GMP-specific phosphodiesterase class I)